jgi:hypothetical protein
MEAMYGLKEKLIKERRSISRYQCRIKVEDPQAGGEEIPLRREQKIKPPWGPDSYRDGGKTRQRQALQDEALAKTLTEASGVKREIYIISTGVLNKI